MYEPIAIDGRLFCDGEVNRHSPISELVNALPASGRVGPREPLQLITIGPEPTRAEGRQQRRPPQGLKPACRATGPATPTSGDWDSPTWAQGA
jgi:hypothetical protein